MGDVELRSHASEAAPIGQFSPFSANQDLFISFEPQNYQVWSAMLIYSSLQQILDTLCL